MDKGTVINEIQKFLEGSNDEYKYLVNVETRYDSNKASCVFHEPGKEKEIREVQFTPFLYVKDIKKIGYVLYNGDKDVTVRKMKSLGIRYHKLNTNKQPRLENGYSVMVTSSISYDCIIKFFKDGGLDPFEKSVDEGGNVIKDSNGRAHFKYRDLFYRPTGAEQFFISTGARLFKGMNEYNEVHKLYFDIETTGLLYKQHRIFAIGVYDNRGFSHLLEVKEDDNDDAEKRIIQDFFNLINYIRPAVIIGHNSESFDFDFIIGRTKILEMSLDDIPTSLLADSQIKRHRAKVKMGNTTDDYVATKMWGYSILDTIHSAKQEQAIRPEIKSVGLKYLCKHENVVEPNRTYIEGDDIGRMWKENKYYIINPANNRYLQVPESSQETGKKLLLLQKKKNKLSNEDYSDYKKLILDNDKDFVKWFAQKHKNLYDDNLENSISFISGKEILRNYLIDDLKETAKIDELYNQAKFMLAKIVPTKFQKIATMGSASIWNLLMTTWSYENKLAIPVNDDKKHFTGGLSRCFRTGYYKNVVKIDFASLYPMLQLEYDIFPIFDTTGVIKKMLMYMTTTRNIYKRLANGSKLNPEEIELLKSTGHDDTYEKLLRGEEFSKEERNAFKVKQLPIKILNNSLFGALGSGFAFNWSDNICAERITCLGRLHLRKVIDWFKQFGCEPLIAVTDGVNFGVPELTSYELTDDGINQVGEPGPVNEYWQYKGESGISALIEYYNDLLNSPYMAVDNDGDFVASYNLARINYSLLSQYEEDGEIKKKVKNIGNTIKKKTMPEYIEEFIDNAMIMILEGRGVDFHNYYKDYVEDIFYNQIPLKKIASKSKVKATLKDYINRGNDKNGREKAKQAHMELLLLDRENTAIELFKDKFEELAPDTEKPIEEYSIDEINKLVADYMPPEPEVGDTVYYVNTGTRKSHNDVKAIKDKETGEVIETQMNSRVIKAEDIEENPEMMGHYNVEKYLDAFNKLVVQLLKGFIPEVRERFLVKIKRSKVKGPDGKKTEKIDLVFEQFTNDELKLMSFEHDKLEDVYYLEPEEILFWNMSGYNPYLIWDGLKIPENNPLKLDEYNRVLAKLSEKMNGMGILKSVNDKINIGEYILYKKDKKYDVGYRKEDYIEIIKENVDVS